jgi:microcompartment protein CcmK/EutM
MDIFLLGLMAVSTLTGLVTEAVKKILMEHNINYRANTVAAIVSAVLSVGVSIGYLVLMSIGFSAQIVVCIVALVFMSWLCAMVGYDKVIGLFKTNKKG